MLPSPYHWKPHYHGMVLCIPMGRGARSFSVLGVHKRQQLMLQTCYNLLLKKITVPNRTRLISPPPKRQANTEFTKEKKTKQSTKIAQKQRFSIIKKNAITCRKPPRPSRCPTSQRSDPHRKTQACRPTATSNPPPHPCLQTCSEHGAWA